MTRSKPHRRRSFRRSGPIPGYPLGSSGEPTAAEGDAGTAAHAEPTEPESTTPEGIAFEVPTAEPPAPDAPPVEVATSEIAEPLPLLPEIVIPEPSSPPDARITALLSEISELRLSAATHLTVAAAAMDAGRPDIAAELIDAQQRDVARLRLRAEELLVVEGETAEQARRSVAHAAALEESGLLATARTPATKSLRRMPSGSDVAVLPRRAETSRTPRWSVTGAVLAIAVALTMAVLRPLAPHAEAPSADEITASVVASLDANIDRSYDQLQATAKPKAPATDVDLATARLHADLRRLLPIAATDPDAARRVLDVLRAERDLLAEHAPGALAAYLPAAIRIVSQLRISASPAVLAILPPVEAMLPQSAAATAGLPPAPKPAPDPIQPPAASGGGTDGSSSGATDTGDADQPAAPAPVVQLPDVPQLPPAPPTGGTSGGGSNTGGDSGSGGSSTGGGSDATSIQIPLPQLPAPLVLDTTAN